PGVLPRLLPACVAMALCGAIVARFLARAKSDQVVAAGERVRNPFSLRQAIVFAAIYAVISLGVKAVQQYMAQGLMFVAAAVGSVADADAVTIALSRLGADESGWRNVAAAITLAAVTNTIVKLGIGWFRGDAGFRRYVTG